MALNPQPYLSDSTDEFLIDALPAIAAGIDPWDVVFPAIQGADPGRGDNMERVLGFLQLWLTMPQILTEHYIPMLQGLLEDDIDLDTEERASIQDQLMGAKVLSETTPETDLFSNLGTQLVEVARAELETPEMRNQYGTWFVDQRAEALSSLADAFSGLPSVGMIEV
jgi:hypothetical protein